MDGVYCVDGSSAEEFNWKGHPMVFYVNGDVLADFAIWFIIS